MLVFVLRWAYRTLCCRHGQGCKPDTEARAATACETHHSIGVVRMADRIGGAVRFPVSCFAASCIPASGFPIPGFGGHAGRSDGGIQRAVEVDRSPPDVGVSAPEPPNRIEPGNVAGVVPSARHRPEAGREDSSGSPAFRPFPIARGSDAGVWHRSPNDRTDWIDGGRCSSRDFDCRESAILAQQYAARRIAVGRFGSIGDRWMDGHPVG